MIKKLAFITALALLSCPPAMASSVGDELTFSFTSDHCTGNCGPQSSFATVEVTQTATDQLTFVFTALNGNTFINTGFPLTFGFDLQGTPVITYSGLTAGWSVPGGNPQSAGTFHMDGFGDFEYGVLWDQQGGGAGTTSLSFTITGTGLTLESLIVDAQGAFFALDIRSGTNGNTGLVDDSLPGTPRTVGVPGPVLGAGLPGLLSGFGLWFLNRMRRRRNAI